MPSLGYLAKLGFITGSSGSSAVLGLALGSDLGAPNRTGLYSSILIPGEQKLHVVAGGIDSVYFDSTGLVTDKGVTLDHLDFAETPTAALQVGRLRWNTDDGTVEVGLKGGTVALQVGQESVLRVVNKTGGTISHGVAVYVNGAQGNRPTVQLADADSAVTADTLIGLVTEDITNNQEGFVTINGLVRGVDTSGWTEGDALYLSSTAGTLTNVKPSAPAHAVRVGFALNSTNNGAVLVAINTGTDVGTLHDVLLTSLADKDVLVYNSTTQLWENSGVAFEPYGSIATHAAVTSGVHGISAFGATLVDDADAAAARATLGFPAIGVDCLIIGYDTGGPGGYGYTNLQVGSTGINLIQADSPASALEDLGLSPTDTLSLAAVRAGSSGGLLLEAENGTAVGLLGDGNTADVTWYGVHQFTSATFAGSDPGSVSAGQVAIGGGVIRAAGAGEFGGRLRSQVGVTADNSVWTFNGEASIGAQLAYLESGMSAGSFLSLDMRRWTGSGNLHRSSGVGVYSPTPGSYWGGLFYSDESSSSHAKTPYLNWGSGAVRVMSDLVVGTDPGGSELVRVGGSLRCSSIVGPGNFAHFAGGNGAADGIALYGGTAFNSGTGIVAYSVGHATSPDKIGFYTSGFTLRASVTPSLFHLAVPLQLNNTAVAETPTPTHTITIRDATGTTYRVPCVV